MADADRRVPTAADVERCKEEGRRCYWWLDCMGPEVEELSLDDNDALKFRTPGEKRSYFVADMTGNLAWLGPVNPEPLPWPADTAKP